MNNAYGEVKTGYLGLPVRELIDNSMHIVKGSIPTGCFYYVERPTLKHINTGETWYGISEYDNRITCKDKNNTEFTRKVEEWEVVSINNSLSMGIGIL